LAAIPSASVSTAMTVKEGDFRGADPERQRHDRDRREAGVLPQHARAVSNVRKEMHRCLLLVP